MVCPTVEAQTQLNVALEKERSAVEQHMILKSRVGALESQLSSVKQEKSQLLATVELERAKLETLEESQHRYVVLCSTEFRLRLYFHRESSKLEALRASYQQSIEGLRKEKVVSFFFGLLSSLPFLQLTSSGSARTTVGI